MVELTDSFPPVKGSALHCMDPRFKVLFLALLSISNVKASPTGILLLFLLQLFVLSLSRIRIRAFLLELKYFSVFLLFVFLARAFTTPGERIFPRGFFAHAIPLTEQGVIDGTIVGFKLFLIVMLGFLFVETTAPSKVRAAVVWYFRPVPLIPEKRVGAMLSLLVRFLPMIVRQVKETADAQRARGVENRKNPLYRLSKLTVPMLRKIFLRADELALAMEARGYNENRSLPRLSASKSDWIILAFLVPFPFLCSLI